MNDLFVIENDRVHTKDNYLFADKVTEMRVTKGPWDVIELLVQFWMKKYPQEVEDMQAKVKEYKETLVDKKFGQTKQGKDMERRFSMSFPSGLLMLIRTQYKAEELPFDRAFIKQFLNKYPKFKIAEKD